MKLKLSQIPYGYRFTRDGCRYLHVYLEHVLNLDTQALRMMSRNITVDAGCLKTLDYCDVGGIFYYQSMRYMALIKTPSCVLVYNLTTKMKRILDNETEVIIL